MQNQWVSKRPCRRLMVAIGCWLLLLLAALPARAVADVELTYADTSALMLLATARNALAELPDQPSELERRIRCSTAVTALTGLYQLHGCEWALPVLRDVLRLPDCPELLVGYSRDGRLELRVEPLELHRAVFDDYTVLLCTLASQTALSLDGSEQARLRITLADGRILDAQPLDASHPLWPEVNRLANTFEIPPALPAGAADAFKQIFYAEVTIDQISTVSLVWGDYGMEIPHYGNLEGL